MKVFFTIFTLFFLGLCHSQTTIEIGIQVSRDFHQTTNVVDDHYLTQSIGLVSTIDLKPNMAILLGVFHNNIKSGKGFPGGCGTPPIALYDMELQYTSIHAGMIYDLGKIGPIQPFASLSMAHFFRSGSNFNYNSDPEFSQGTPERIRPSYLLTMIPSIGVDVMIQRGINIKIDLPYRFYLHSGSYQYPQNLGFRVALLHAF